MHAYRDQYAQIFNVGQDVVLIAISVDPVQALFEWARDDQFQFLMASDSTLEVARANGALSTRGSSTNRNLFIVGPDGRIAWRAVPFREVDPTAYEELAEAVDRLAPPRDMN
jgi:alkyl hydroperoxide reductase subunit AhpC